MNISPLLQYVTFSAGFHNAQTTKWLFPACDRNADLHNYGESFICKSWENFPVIVKYHQILLLLVRKRVSLLFYTGFGLTRIWTENFYSELPIHPPPQNEMIPDLAWHKIWTKKFSRDHPPSQNEITPDLAWLQTEIFFFGPPPTHWPTQNEITLDLAWYKFGMKNCSQDHPPILPRWDNTIFGLIQIQTEKCFLRPSIQNEITLYLAWYKFKLKNCSLDHPSKRG